MIALAVLLALAVAVAAIAGTLYATGRRGLLASRVRRRVIVTLKTGDAFSGLLYAADRDVIVLREAQALSYGPRSEHLPVEGEALILRSDVAYIQLP